MTHHPQDVKNAQSADGLAQLLLTQLHGDLLLFDCSADLYQLVLQQRQAQEHAAASAFSTDQQASLDEAAVESAIHHISPLAEPGDDNAGIRLGQLAAGSVSLERADTVFLNDPFAIAAAIDWPDQDEGFAASPLAVTRLLSLCRDRVRHRVFVLLAPNQANGAWSCQDFFALGYQRVTPPAPVNNAIPKLYTYNLQGYKTVPDWLNSRYWANPERWHLSE